jgi:hypothetical protein
MVKLQKRTLKLAPDFETYSSLNLRTSNVMSAEAILKFGVMKTKQFVLVAEPNGNDPTNQPHA